MGPCQYVYEKSVGPVGAMTVGHCLIQMRSGGAVSPPAGSKAGVWWGKRGICENLAFCTTKNGKKQQDCRRWETNLQPLGYKPSAPATELNSSKAQCWEELSLFGWCLTAMSFELFSAMARASVYNQGVQRVPVSPSASSLYISLLVSGVPVPSRTTVLLK